jgi:hypothetical protein
MIDSGPQTITNFEFILVKPDMNPECHEPLGQGAGYGLLVLVCVADKYVPHNGDCT